MGKTQMLGHFVSNMLMLGHAGVRAPRRDARYRMFHVKHNRGQKAKKCLHFFIC